VQLAARRARHAATSSSGTSAAVSAVMAATLLEWSDSGETSSTLTPKTAAARWYQSEGGAINPCSTLQSVDRLTCICRQNQVVERPCARKQLRSRVLGRFGSRARDLLANADQSYVHVQYRATSVLPAFRCRCPLRNRGSLGVAHQ